MNGDGMEITFSRIESEAGTPVVVFGMTLYNNSVHLSAALNSIASQTLTNFSVVMVDDCSQDDTAHIARAMATDDPRFSYHPNARRTGMIEAWRTAFRTARSLYPSMQYFAWASDHDIWHATWAEKLVAALDANKEAVMAYPLTQRIDAQGNTISHDIRKGIFSTRDCPRSIDRIRAVTRLRRNFGNMVYGLYRAEALEKSGVFRDVLLPDRLLMQELALEGGIIQIEEVLWMRRFKKSVTLKSQKKSLWAQSKPFSSYFPWEVVHTYHVLGAMRRRIGSSRMKLGEAVTILLEQLRFCVSSLIRRRFGFR